MVPTHEQIGYVFALYAISHTCTIANVKFTMSRPSLATIYIHCACVQRRFDTSARFEMVSATFRKWLSRECLFDINDYITIENMEMHSPLKYLDAYIHVVFSKISIQSPSPVLV